MKAKSNSTILELTDISKRFPGVQALDRVSLSLQTGEIHGLVGENGAGKSTLMNVIGGVVVPDSGSIRLHSQEVNIPTPARAQELGIAFIHQELALFPNLDVASNIFIADLPRHAAGVVNDNGLKQRARVVLDRVGLSYVNPTQKVKSLSPGEQQLVEIGRCLVQDVDILVFDEPTSSLTSREVESLFTIIRELRSQGVTVLYVTHRLGEVFDICERVTVLRDGEKIGTVATDEIDRQALVQMIVGREVVDASEHEVRRPGQTILRVGLLSRRPAFRDVSFELHRGEVLGITGLLGSGRTELARAIFGLDRYDSGTIWVDGAKVRIRHPGDAIRHGIGFITEERRKEGLILEKPVRDNIVVASLGAFAGWLGWMQPRRESQAAEEQRASLRIATPTVLRRVKFLSGGNQQKVVVGKWLQTGPRIYILDEPTRGIDVGAKAEVHRIINDLVEQGAGVILISSEIPEIVRMSDHVLVMRNGEVVAEFERGQSTASSILLAAVGGSEQ